MRRLFAALLPFALAACQSGETVEFADASITLPEDDVAFPVRAGSDAMIEDLELTGTTVERCEYGTFSISSDETERIRLAPSPSACARKSRPQRWQRISAPNAVASCGSKQSGQATFRTSDTAQAPPAPPYREAPYSYIVQAR